MEPSKIYVEDFMSKEEEETQIMTEDHKKQLWEEKQANFNINSALDGFILK